MNRELENKIQQAHPQADIEVLEYNGFNKKVHYKCRKCGNSDYRNKYNSLLYTKYACKKCNDGTKGKSETQKRVESLLVGDISLVEWRGVNEKAQLLCQRCGKKIFRYPSNILKNPKFCPNCDVSANQIPRTKKEAQSFLNEYAGNEEFELLEYNGSQKASLVKHNCGFIFYRKLWNFKISRGCPKCQRKKSSLENRVEKYLKDNEIKYNFQVHFKDCNNGKSSFDFQCFTNNKQFCLVEVQGQQHYQEIEVFDGLVENKRRDQIKKEYCIANGIPLIEIPYYDISNLDKYLSFLKSSTTISKESTLK